MTNIASEAIVKATGTIVWGSYRKSTFEFEENPSTGYMWVVSTLPDGVTSEKSDFIPGPDTEGVGSPGTRKFTIHCTQPSTVVFELRRRWEPAETPPIRKVTIAIE